MRPDEESLFDQWLDRALAGDAEDPAVFCQRVGGDVAELRERIEAVADLLPESPAYPAEPGLPFERVGAFRLLRRLGEGGMGVVYLAEQEPLRRLVALKVLRPELRASLSAPVRLLREARAVARVRHDHIAALHAAGEENGVLWLAFEHVPGETLAELLVRARDAGTRVPTDRAVRYAAQIARALAAAHDAGVIHRDVKPANIRVRQNDHAVLLDFGLAAGAPGDPTITGSFVGTPAYASPEQVDPDGRALDGRTDVYSLAATLYESLSLRPPFEGDSMERVLHAILTREPTPISIAAPGLSKDLVAVIERAMEKEAERRYQSAADFADDLEAVLSLRPVQARPVPVWRKLRRYARRRPGSAAAALLVILALLSASAMKVVATLDARERAESRRHEANKLLVAARARVLDHARDAEEATDAFLMAKGYTRWQQFQLLDASQAAEFAEAHRRVLEFEAGRAHVHAEVLACLARARELSPGLAGADDIVLDLERVRHTEALRRGDVDPTRLTMTHGSGAVDRSGKARGSAVILRFDRITEGATLHLFAIRPMFQVVGGGDGRSVPTAIDPDAELPIAPGSFALRVTQSVDGISQTDLVCRVAGQPIRGTVWVLRGTLEIPTGARLVEIAGEPVLDKVDAMLRVKESPESATVRFALPHPPLDSGSEARSLDVTARALQADEVLLGDARDFAEAGGARGAILRDGVLQEILLPAEAGYRTTAIPLARCEATRLEGSDPLPLEPGAYLLTADRDGYEPWRLALHLNQPQQTRLRVVMRPVGTAPPGFVWIACDAWLDDPHPGFYMQEREVTAAEYLEFLSASGHTPDGPWPMKDGRREFPDDVLPDHPALLVSWRDASAYARWKNDTALPDPGAGVVPDGYRYQLPTFHELIQAGLGGGDKPYTYGGTFGQTWQKSRTARRGRVPEAVLSFPIDESLYGVYDLMGSAMEWLEPLAFYDGGPERALGGGSWLHANPEDFRLDLRHAALERDTDPAFGMRLVLAPIEGRR